jgi:hypothetical protein
VADLELSCRPVRRIWEVRCALALILSQLKFELVRSRATTCISRGGRFHKSPPFDYLTLGYGFRNMDGYRGLTYHGIH